MDNLKTLAEKKENLINYLENKRVIFDDNRTVYFNQF